MFFRLIGGAFGVALLTALLVGELNSGALAIPGHDVLGPTPGSLCCISIGKSQSVQPFSPAYRTRFAPHSPMSFSTPRSFRH
jgi:hypothetical protein